MNDHERRLKAIELTLTPRLVVAAWLKNAIDTGTFEDGARRTPPAREVVANAVRNTVRNSMKGQAEPMIHRNVLLKLWEESERQTARMMREIAGTCGQRPKH